MARQRRAKDKGPSGHPKANMRSSGKSQQPNAIFGTWTHKMALFISFNIVILILSIIYFFYQSYLENIVITPLNVPKVVTKTGLDMPSMYWGSYRSGVYFGMQARHPMSLLMGLMWFTQRIINNAVEIHHWCEQWTAVKNYSWVEHDGERFGIQHIEDGNSILTTSFVKNPIGKYGGDFTAKFSMKTKPDGEVMPYSLLFYTLAPPDNTMDPIVTEDGKLTSIKGYTEALGKFRITFVTEHSGNAIFMHNYLRAKVADATLLKDTILRNLALYKAEGKYQILGLIGRLNPLPSQVPENGRDFLVHQVTFYPPFEMEVMFESESVSRIQTLTGKVYDAKLRKLSDAFHKRFEEVFHLASIGYSEDDIRIAETAMSNMLGGIGYFYGSSLVQSNHTKDPVPYWEAPLYTAVPSRSFFPRGFLWDEGFHNLLILRWNPHITTDIIAHWLDLMNIEGWIPREQILGVESRERVPREFVVQRNTNANPPTFFLTMEGLLRQMKTGASLDDLRFLRLSLPRLKVWFEWFNRTQSGLLPGTYRWRGRDSETNKELNPKTLTSGLDDFPRASHPTVDERHVDLHCWMAYSSKVLADIADFLGEPSGVYRETYLYLSDNKLLDEYYWSPSFGMYSDYGYHSTHVKLIKEQIPNPPGVRDPPRIHTVRVAYKQPTLMHIGNFGYVSLFPFLLQIVKPNSPKLGKLLTDLKDPKLLWTSYGLRSLSKTSPYYEKRNTEHDPPYWRGAIWINMNYLAVRSLHHYSNLKGPYQSQARELYEQLRSNVVANVIRQYRRTGFFWEQYDDENGEGHGSHPFTGWSALIVLMMAELY